MQYGLKTHAVKHEPIALQLLEQTLKLGSQLRFTRLLERIVTETVRCTFSQATDDCLLFVFSWLVSRGVNCSRTAGRIEMPLVKNSRRPQIFCLEISGPKVVLLCKFSLYRAVRAPVESRALRLQPHQPYGWSGLAPTETLSVPAVLPICCSSCTTVLLWHS